MNPEFAITLRAKKLGILIKDARLSAGKTMEECGKAIGVSGSTISSYEKGKSSPSLPELEMLAFYLKVPIERFWKDSIIAEEDSLFDQLEIEHSQVIRHREIGKILEEARNNLEITFEEITEKTGITYGRMKRFEAGNSPVPLPELELLSNLFEIKLVEFFDNNTEIGKWLRAQGSIADFLTLSPETRDFVTKPVNQPYIEIAKKLSTISADRLRTIAEGILEITI